MKTPDMDDLFNDIVDSIGSYSDVLAATCSALIARSAPETSIAIQDQPGLLSLISSRLLGDYLRNACASAFATDTGDIIVVDLGHERPTVDIFDALVLAVVGVAGGQSRHGYRDPKFNDWARSLGKLEPGLKGISRAELASRRYSDLDAVLVVRGIDTIHSQPLDARAASAQSAASALGFKSIVFLTASAGLTVDRTFWVYATQQEFEKVTTIVLNKFGPERTTLADRMRMSMRPAGFWEKLRNLALSSTSERSTAPMARSTAEPRVIADNKTSQRARALIVAATFPSVGNLVRAASRYRDLVHLWDAAVARERGMAGPVGPNLGLADATMLLENDDQAIRESLVRALFLALLEIVRPDLIHAANSDLCGWQQLFRLQLMFSRLTSSERLLLGMKNPRWDGYLEDSQLRAFFWQAMGIEGVSEPLVEPFASATAVRRHFREMLTKVSKSEEQRQQAWKATLLGLRSVLGEAEAALESSRLSRHALSDARNKFQATLKRAIDIANRSDIESIALREALDELQEQAKTQQVLATDDERARELAEALRAPLRRLRAVVIAGIEAQISTETHVSGPVRPEDASDSEPVDAVERSLRIIGLLELISGPNAPSLPEESGRETTRESAIFFGTQQAKSVLTKAALSPDDALAADALVGHARLILTGLNVESDDSQRNAKLDLAASALEQAELRVRNDPLGRLAVKLGQALLAEFRGLAPRAAELAREVIRASEGMGAKELTARAVALALRCDSASYRKTPWRQLARTQAFIDVQTARSPLVADLDRERSRRVFISYRTETRELIRAVSEAAIRSSDFRVPVWVDYQQIDPRADDFREAMQLGLDRAGMVLLVLSPGYFRSHWCSYELATTLARRRTAGLRMAWIAATTEQVPKSETPAEYAKRLAELAAFTPEDRLYLISQIDQVVLQAPLIPDIVRVGAAAEASQYESIVAGLREIAMTNNTR